MNTDREFIQKEINLITDALNSEEGEEKLRDYLLPLVRSKVQKFLETCHKNKGIEIDEGIREKSLDAGWTYFDFAIEKYSERLNLVGRENIHSFSAYFTWFIKQGVWDYLHEKRGRI